VRAKCFQVSDLGARFPSSSEPSSHTLQTHVIRTQIHSSTYGYFRHTVWQYSSLEKDIVLDMLPGRWTEGRPKMLWMENITSRTSLMTENITMEDRLEWRRIIQDVINPPSKDDWRQDKTRLIHGVSKKVSHLMLDNNFGKCIPIFKILSQIHSWENSLCTYLVKVENSKMLPNFYIECDN